MGVVLLDNQVNIDVRRAEALLQIPRAPARNEPSYAISECVNVILNRVRTHGDKALIEFTRWFDRLDLSSCEFRIGRDEITNAYSQIHERELTALEEVATRLRIVSQETLDRLSFNIEVTGTKIRTAFRPLREIGCYVPGGTAAYPSSLLMCAIPAQVAGVNRLVVCTPPKRDGVSPLTLVAADICGVGEVYQVGGAQAIAAMSYGTETIAPVEKIVGPGNAYVTEAKRLLSSRTLIDMPAGPSELLVIADASASARSIALDLISQAEHSSDAVSVLLSDSRDLCNRVASELASLVPRSPRREITRDSLSRNGGIYHCDTLDQCVQLANEFAAEHVQIMADNAAALADRVTSAGLILLGAYTPVAASDYGLGVNHVLPTQGYAKTYSGLSVMDFVKLVHIVEASRESLAEVSSTLITLAEAEGLQNHARSIQGRFEQ